MNIRIKKHNYQHGLEIAGTSFRLILPWLFIERLAA